MEGIKVGSLVLYDVETLSKLLDVQERTIRAYLRQGKLKGRKMARKWYVTEESLQAYFEQGEDTAYYPPAEESVDFLDKAIEAARRKGLNEQPPVPGAGSRQRA
jgi:hypothetical protein